MKIWNVILLMFVIIYKDVSSRDVLVYLSISLRTVTSKNKLVIIYSHNDIYYYG